MNSITSLKENIGNSIIELIEAKVERCLLANGFNATKENNFGLLTRVEFSTDNDSGITEVLLDGKTIMCFGEFETVFENNVITTKVFIKE